jgi:16S rRNA (guanine1207-N2)-methyltransferase
MTADRLSHAIEAGLPLPTQGRIALFLAPGDAPVGALDLGRCDVIQTMRPDVEAWEARGVTVRATPAGPYAAAIVTLPRARDWAEAVLAEAEAVTEGLVVLDGAKTDGVDSMLKALKARGMIEGSIAKAHGKVGWFTAQNALKDWRRPATQRNAEGDTVAPGLFSADGADPGSVALAAALPASLKGTLADLGAGWGWLSRAVLERAGVTTLHLVEAEKRALDCAQVNVTDPRAAFHWADATRWSPPAPLDAVVTNPPFHIGRKADPALGRAFIAAAARMLAPHGALWLVANRHLPYEAELSAHFATVDTAQVTSRFKILHAMRPKRSARRR